MTITFFVEGTPAPGGSKNAFPFKRADGSLGVRVVDDGKGNKAWRAIVGWTAKARMAELTLQPLPGALQVAFDFIMPRPKTVTRPRHIVKPDLTKLMRSTEDAMTGIVWLDDAQIVSQALTKRYASDGEASGVFIVVNQL